MKFSKMMIALLIVIFSVSPAMGQERMKDTTFVMGFNRPETLLDGKWQRLIYEEIFRRLGIHAEFRYYPTKRGSAEADAGNIDGESARIYEYAAEHPNLVRVEEPIFAIQYSAFAVNNSIPQLTGWDSLKGTDYKVEYRRGSKICELNLPNVVSTENLSNITESIQGLKKLVAGRIDVFVEEESSIFTLLQTPEFKESNIRSVGVMDEFPVYPYLHKTHASLAPKMADVIKAMKTEGVIEKYRTMVEKEFGSGM